MRFSEQKAAQAAALLLELGGGSMNHMKLIKLLYLADRSALLQYGRPITFDHYYSLKHGPILSFTLDLVNSDLDPDEPNYWHKLVSERDGHEVRLAQPVLPELDQLSEAEQEVVRGVFAKHGHLDQWQLRDLTHQLPEWQDPQRSRLSISIEDILRGEGFGDEEIGFVCDSLAAESSANEAWT
jgi:uncharacterized phage-associated protein